MKYAHIDEKGALLGWYSDDVHDTIPAPHITVSVDEWQNALKIGANQYNNTSGKFEHVEPIPTVEQLASSARYERDKALKALDEVVANPLRFSELSEEQRLGAATYRKLLLDVPQQKSFPTSYTLPKTPEWLS